MKHLLLVHPSAGDCGDMIMDLLLNLGADLAAVREAADSAGCRLEAYQQEKRSIIACRAAVNPGQAISPQAKAQVRSQIIHPERESPGECPGRIEIP